MREFVVILYFMYFITVVSSQVADVSLNNKVTCDNETECNLSMSTDSDVKSDVETSIELTNEFTTELLQDVPNVTSETKNENVTIPTSQQTSLPITTSAPNPTGATNRAAENPVSRKTHLDICECDLTVSWCDINCCCDSDCSESDTLVFSHCVDQHVKVYDSRYCSDIQHNNTEYFLERLANNLFCIVYENHPPSYTTSYTPEVPNRKVFNEVIAGIKKSQFKWQWDKVYVPPQFNANQPYRDGDILWKLQNNFMKPLDLPQTGFNSLCSFKKPLKFLQNWKESCMQVDLSNNNLQLFTPTFHNFTVISSPVLYNESFSTSENEGCPKNVCLPVASHYCPDSWDLCYNETTLNGSCSNNACENIVIDVRYIIIHNGTRGINSINAYFKLGNVSQHFYQRFELIYEWADANKSNVFALSGNPGYLMEKPIIIGTFITNKTDNTEYNHISINRTNHFLTLPRGQKNGECHNQDRYIVGFGEDLKLRCKIILQTDNFTADSCAKIQNQSLEALLQNSLHNVTEVDQYKIYVSKLGHFNNNGTSDWVKILLDRIPKNVVTGHVNGDQIVCSGLVTSMRIDVIHTLLTKPERTDNHKILALAITFSDEIDIVWPKCMTDNCTDSLTVDTVSYVAFHDTSRPFKYYFADGPSLDINLPHDFFYPFMNDSKSIEASLLLVSSSLIEVLLVIIFLS